MIIMNRDREILRQLATEVAEISASPGMTKLKEDWKRHNALQSPRPMICVSPEGSWREIITEKDLLCEDELMRSFERVLRMKIYWATGIGDDTPISEYFNVPYQVKETPYLLGMEDVEQRVSDTGSFHYKVMIDDLAEGLEKLRFRKVTLDRQESERKLSAAQESFGDILKVRHRGQFWWTLGITAEVIKLIGLEALMIDMYEDPDGLHRLMAWFRDEHLNLMNQYESLGILSLNNEDDLIASGGIGYTDELPKGNGPVSYRDLWGFSESQETVGISPQMFGEFIFPYQLPMLERFGINCYGCCEPVEGRWEWIKTIPRLRRISVSPWSNKEQMAQADGRNLSRNVRKAVAYIMENYQDAITLEDVAEEIGVSAMYAGQLFKKEIGVSFKRYLSEARVEKAKELLRSGNYRIYEVSRMTGYQTTQYFCNVFKKVTGISPGEFMEYENKEQEK